MKNLGVKLVLVILLLQTIGSSEFKYCQIHQRVDLCSTIRNGGPTEII